ncbi:MAG: hypothetical protein JST58_00670 [Bacteroidetes bacterium]|nr:hypothetical protein [Bacteroidota bacterium]
MKIKHATLTLATILTIIGCKKNDEIKSSNGFGGSYRGNVVDSINNSYYATLNDYTIVIVPTNTNGQVSLTNNLIITNAGVINGNTFTIPKTIAVQSAYKKVVEWANGHEPQNATE